MFWWENNDEVSNAWDLNMTDHKTNDSDSTKFWNTTSNWVIVNHTWWYSLTTFSQWEYRSFWAASDSFWQLYVYKSCNSVDTDLRTIFHNPDWEYKDSDLENWLHSQTYTDLVEIEAWCEVKVRIQSDTWGNLDTSRIVSKRNRFSLKAQDIDYSCN